MNESSFWAYLKGVMAQCWEATRIETSTALGVPDVTYTIPQGHGWIELKYLQAFPKRATTAVRLAHFTDAQKNWMRQRGRLADAVWLFVRVGNEFFLFDWRQALECETWTAGEWRQQARGFWAGRLDPLAVFKVLKTGGVGEGRG